NARRAYSPQRSPVVRGRHSLRVGQARKRELTPDGGATNTRAPRRLRVRCLHQEDQRPQLARVSAADTPDVALAAVAARHSRSGTSRTRDAAVPEPPATKPVRGDSKWD